MNPYEQILTSSGIDYKDIITGFCRSIHPVYFNPPSIKQVDISLLPNTDGEYTKVLLGNTNLLSVYSGIYKNIKSTDSISSTIQLPSGSIIGEVSTNFEFFVSNGILLIKNYDEANTIRFVYSSIEREYDNLKDDIKESLVRLLVFVLKNDTNNIYSTLRQLSIEKSDAVADNTFNRPIIRRNIVKRTRKRLR